MAIQINHTDSHGEIYPLSYWKPVQINFSESDGTAHLTFYGYPDADRKGKRIIGQKSYTLDGGKITSYFKSAPQDVTSVRGGMMAAAYKLAKETLDKNIGTEQSPNMVSHFNGGIDV